MGPSRRARREEGGRDLLRETAEDRLVQNPGVFYEITGKPSEEILHEIEVHHIELEIQNEELRKAQKDLVQSRDRYIDLYDFAPVGYFTLTDKALIAEVNLTGATMLGVVRQHLIHTRFRKFITPGYQDRWDHFFLAGLTQGEKQTCSLQLKQQDGHVFSAWVEALRVEVGIGSFQVRITVSDVTRQIQAEEQLKETNRYQRSLIEASIDPFFIINPEGKITDVNIATMNITGRSREYLIGTDFSAYFTDLQIACKGYLSVFEMGQVRNYPLDICHVDGHITPVLYSASVYLNEGGDIGGVFAVVRDITELKRAEEGLKTSEIRYRRLFESAQDGILILNRDDGEIIDSNPFIEILTGYSKEELYGKTLWDIGFFTDQIASKNAFEELLKKNYIRYEDLPIETKNGKRIDVEFVSNVYSIDSQTLVIQCNIRDITERKRAEEAVHEANHKLRLLTGLTRHDILNKLMVMQIFHDLAIEASDLATNHEYLSQAHQAGDRMEAIIGFTRDYESFGLISSGWQQIYPIIASAKSEVSLGNVILENQIPKELDVYSDPIIRKVFTTLLENAIRHGGKDISTIRISCSEYNNILIITFEDDGVGIPEEEKEYVFNKGYGNHTGIGLFLTREILSITGLSIREVGIPGKGASFEIVVPTGKFRFLPGEERMDGSPLIIREDTIHPGRIYPIWEVEDPIIRCYDQSGETISLLFIDDDPMLLSSGKHYLEKRYGFKVTTAESAEKAIHLLSETLFDAIISDYEMPKMDGIELLKHVKAAGDTTPFIILTGRGGEDVVIEALNTGADFYILKRGDPKVQFSDLSTKIRYAVSRRRTEKELFESQKMIADVTQTLKLKDFAIESSLNGAVIADSSGSLTFVNPAFLNMWGYDNSDEVLGRCVFSFWQDEEEGEKVESSIQETGEWSGDLVGMREDGKPIVFMVSANLIHDLTEVPAGMFVSFIDITEQKHMENLISISLHEKETLLREIHHRVKNNLQIVTSLLSLQIRRLDHPKAIEALRDSQNRVKTMALVHEHLYQGSDISHINLENYIKSLATMVVQNFQQEDTVIQFEISAHNIFVDIDTAIPLGLITNELITNSFKYAFNEKKHGTIFITATENQDILTFIVADDGVGIREISLSPTGSLGLRLVNNLTSQLNGSMAIDRQNGTTFTLVIPKTSKTEEDGINEDS